MKTRYLSRAVALALVAASGSAFAITNNESNASIPFSFSNPGARNLAMGGAFLGAADDATAGYSNPAGLTRLGTEQQFAAEFRRYSMETPYAGGGTVNASPFDVSNVDYRNDSDSLSNLSFVGWVMPVDDWAISFYRHHTVDLDQSYRTDPIFFQGTTTFIRPYEARTDLEIVTWGASFAMNLSDSLSAGIGLTRQDFELGSSVTRYDETFATAVNRQTQDGDDNDFGYTLGFLYRGADNLSIGLSYRSETEFDYDFQNVVFNGCGAGCDLQIADAKTRLKTPDVLGIGLSWRATDRLSMNLDINRVGYSNLTEDVADAFFAGGEFEELGDPQILRSIEIEDSIEPRLGLEYTFIDMSTPFSLRAGTWRERRHTLEFNADPESLAFEDNVSAVASAVLFSAGDDEMHYSVGFGWAFPSFQVDFAYDTSDTLDTMSLSGVYRF